MTDEDFTIALNFRLLPFIISGASSGFARYQIARRLSGAAIVHASRVIYPKMSSLSLFSRSLLLLVPYYCWAILSVCSRRARARARSPSGAFALANTECFHVAIAFQGGLLAAGFYFVRLARDSGIQEFSFHFIHRVLARARASARLSRYCCVLALCSGICLLIQVLTLASLVIFLS